MSFEAKPIRAVGVTYEEALVIFSVMFISLQYRFSPRNNFEAKPHDWDESTPEPAVSLEDSHGAD